MARTEVPKETTYISVDQEKCNGCGKCLVCLFEAVKVENKKAYIDPVICERCGCCWSLCPKEAIAITYDYQGSDEYNEACRRVPFFVK